MSSVYKNIVVVTTPEDIELTYSSYRKLSQAFPELKLQMIYRHKKPYYYKGFKIRKAPLNRGTEN